MASDAMAWRTQSARPVLLLPLLLVSVSAQLRVMAPETLMNQFSTSAGRVDGSTATFGAPFFGERVLGQLVFGESTNHKGNHTHCRDEDYQVPKPDRTAATQHERAEAQLLQIVIVRRGGCSFVTKVRVAEAKGAHAVVIVDREDSKLTTNDIRRIIVGDDGYGGSIKIPSMLVSNSDGQKLIEATKGAQPVIVELAWDVPTDHVVLVDFWMSSASAATNRFLKEFAPLRRKLKHAIKFVPHYHVFAMAGSSDYHELCTDSTAKFCAEDPDGPGPITGKMVIEEDLRQLCIHEMHKREVLASRAIAAHKSQNKVEYSHRYWSYIERFWDMCPIEAGQTKPDPMKSFGKECSERVMISVGIVYPEVEQCVNKTYKEKLENERANVAWSPSAIRINYWRYTGDTSADLVMRAICSGFVQQPPVCQHLREPINQQAAAVMQRKEEMKYFIPLLCTVTVLGFVALVCYRRSLTTHIHTAIREEVMLEVQSQMASYNQLSG